MRWPAIRPNATPTHANSSEPLCATDLKLAQRATFDEAYRDAKRESMVPIAGSVTVLDERTARTVSAHTRQSYMYLLATVAILLLLIGAAITVTVRLYRRVYRDDGRIR